MKKERVKKKKKKKKKRKWGETCLKWVIALRKEKNQKEDEVSLMGEKMLLF